MEKTLFSEIDNVLENLEGRIYRCTKENQNTFLVTGIRWRLVVDAYNLTERKNEMALFGYDKNHLISIKEEDLTETERKNLNDYLELHPNFSLRIS